MPPTTKDVRIGNRLQKIARLIEAELRKAGADPKDVQFSLMIWGSQPNGRMQYVSNGTRDSVKIAMQELVAKWDRDGEDLGKPTLPLGGFAKVNKP